MPRFFFDVAEGHKRVRPAGNAELADEDMARAYALGLAETLVQGGDAAQEEPRLVIIRKDDGSVMEIVQAETRSGEGG